MAERDEYDRATTRWINGGDPEAIIELKAMGGAITHWVAVDVRDGLLGWAGIDILRAILGRGPEIPEASRGRWAEVRGVWLLWLGAEGYL